MADINVSVTVPAVITATATDPNSVTVAVTTPAPITVSASVGNVGDMTKAVYDTDNSGVVDNAAALGGIAAPGFVQTADTSWIDLTDGGATTLHTHASPANVDPSVADNFVSFSNATGAQKDSGKNGAHLVYTLTGATGSNHNPLDATTYLYGTTYGVTLNNGLYIPMAGTIITVDFSVYVATALGTTETSSVYLRLNNTTDTLISSGVQANTRYQHYRANVSIVVAKDDYIEWKWVTPTWATNPTGVRLLGIALIQV